MPSITLNPTAETYANKESPSSTHNGNNYLRCGYGSASDKCYYTYLKFDIQGSIPKGSTITSAVLSLYSYSNSCWQASTNLVCRRVTSSWTQSGLTWDNRPSGTGTNSVTGTFSGYNTWYSFTITGMVQDMLDASTDYGLVVRQNDETLSKAKCFRKNTSGYEPKLVISYTEPSIKITFYGNGATGVGSNSNATSYNPTSNLTQTVSYSGSYSSFDLYNVSSLFVKTGYSRKSSAEAWRVGSASATTYMPDSGANFTTYINKAHAIDNKLSLYANWAPNSYKLTIKPNGGSFNSSTSDFVTDGSSSKPHLIYGQQNWYTIGKATRTGYTLTGYFTAASGGTKVYDANGLRVTGTSYWNSSGNYCYAGALTVYAQWTENYLTINFYPNGGTQTSSQASSYPLTNGYFSRNYYYDNDYSENGVVNVQTLFTKENYTVEDANAWNTSSGGTGTKLNHNTPFATGQKIAEHFGKSIASSSLTGSNAIKLYAIWIPATRKGSIVIYSSTGKNSYKPYIYENGAWVPYDAYYYSGGWQQTSVKTSSVDN